MKNRLILLFFLFISIFSLSAQKVGLVLSGGGAKGVAHIGVIKALEENGIPIDYVAGTSMGAIVGSMYAMGFTPDEMMEIITSEDFKYWLRGEEEPEYIFYYRKSDLTPPLIEFSFRLSKQDTAKIKTKFLPTHLVSSHQMNYAFLSLFSQPTAASKGDFNRLFVPFRCVASDIYKKEPVIFSKGSLGDAVRASMSFPLVFKPVTIDSCLLFDGGIYNNFPVDVMRDDFHPDIMIGCVVTKNPQKPTEEDIILQLENMVMAKTDYTIPPEEGVLFQFDLKNINMFDFSKADLLFKMGYDSVMTRIEEIKSRIARRVPLEEVNKRRKEFRGNFPDLKFQNIIIEGVDSLQKIYIEREFHNKNEVFDINQFKINYFKLLSDNQISEITPTAHYNQKNDCFDLHLKVKTEDHLKVTMGINISSSVSNQAYVGASYQNLKEYAQTAYLEAQFGKIYNSLNIGTRWDASLKKDFYLKMDIILHRFDYFEGNKLFYLDNRQAFFSQSEMFGKIKIGFPLTQKGRMELGIGFGNLTDNYLQDKFSTSSQKKNDKSKFLLGNAFVRAETNAFTRPTYPTKGYHYFASLQLLGGDESFTFADPLRYNMENNQLWGQFQGKYDRYFPLSKKVVLGTYGEIVFSTRNLLPTYTATIMQAPAFQPTLHSLVVFNEAFRANQFGAIGLKPIYQFNDQIHFRTEMYCFVPYKKIYSQSDGSAVYSSTFSSTQFMAESSLVVSFKKATASAFVNYYSSGTSHWNFGVNIGILLFKPKFME